MALLSLILAAATATAAPLVPEPDPSHMTLKEIRAHNKLVGKDHPQFIKCRRDVEIGTLAKAHTVCRTLRDWVEADRNGNRTARETLRLLDETRGNVGN